ADAETSRNLAVVLGVVFVVGLFVAWILVRRRRYSEADYDYEDDYEYEPDGSEAYGYEAEDSDEVVQLPETVEPEIDVSQPLPEQVWVDGAGWVAAEDADQVDEVAESEADQSEPAEDSTTGLGEIAVSGGTVSFGSSETPRYDAQQPLFTDEYDDAADESDTHD
ncbi:MAG: hypothetical protein ACC652_13100, partial [Acidimicrobiales bacterium]